MKTKAKANKQFLLENEELRARIQEDQETLRAIRSGEVDALVVSGQEGEQVFTLRGAEHPYRVLVESMNEGALTMSSDGSILYANRRFAEMVGAPLEKIINSSIYNFIWPPHLENARALVEYGARGNARKEINLNNRDGILLPTYVSVSPSEVEGVSLVSAIVTDLTEQELNQTIVAAERLSRSILEQALEVILVCDSHGRIIRCSQSARDLCGKNVLFQSFDTVFHLEFKRKQRPRGGVSAVSSFLSTKKTVRGREVTFKRDDGQVYDLLLSAGPLYDEQGIRLGFVVMLVDMTKHRQMEKELRRSKDHLELRVKARTEELRNLSAKLLVAQEEERRRIALEIHDGISQHWVLVKLRVEETFKYLDEEERTAAGDILSLIQLGLEESRRIQMKLRPALLDQLGIVATIGWHCREFQKAHSDIHIEMKITVQEDEIPVVLKTVVYRIIQEALSNAAKHSKANLVNLTLEKKPGTIELVIQDNGQGFDFDAATSLGSLESGLGITGMSERAHLSGGTFAIESVKGVGTTVHLSWPVS